MGKHYKSLDDLCEGEPELMDQAMSRFIKWEMESKRLDKNFKKPKPRPFQGWHFSDFIEVFCMGTGVALFLLFLDYIGVLP